MGDMGVCCLVLVFALRDQGFKTQNTKHGSPNKNCIKSLPECIVKGLPPLVRKVKHWLRRHQVGRGWMVVAVSGGPDSVALLRAMATIRRDGMVIAHLNHMLRGPESDGDEAFVRDLHAALVHTTARQLELKCERVDTAANARLEGANLESVARRIRYDWLIRVARESAAKWVATGHTADDQAETVLHRLLRGTGLKGLRGIAARRKLAEGITAVRPLLDVTRAEVLEYLREEGQTYRVDSTNVDPAFTRNRIRSELLPLIAERFNPSIAAILCRLAEQADEMFTAQDIQAHALLAAAERPRAGPLLILDRQPLAEAPRNLIREALRVIWEREGWSQGEMGFHDWDRLAGAALGETTGVDLPGGIRVLCRDHVVQIGPRDSGH
jgi:tRNA(Ile)-lysidine synthase